MARERTVPDARDLEDVTRFNERWISRSPLRWQLTEQVERDREALLASEQASRKQAEAANRAKPTLRVSRFAAAQRDC